MVRHSESVPPTVGGPDQQRRPLTAAGLAAASALGPRLAALRPTAIASSPYLRAIQTVTPVANLSGLSVDVRWELREWEMPAVHRLSWPFPDRSGRR